ncbi:GNAT family acetyltransferase [Sorangium cellulosum]|uniref:GNAT family acetyltransferase n=1 Tax=Sorangium cellulosum TaxID=56 RepID=A0A2L0EHV1_SORCE|nr:GNAT family N-acetyltransferase [Sorangium cellulosum]AUX38882.1 GNAT family acetyltransferase [Sorangium cellulosum]
MFADVELAARIDQAEAHLCIAIATAVREHHPDTGVLIAPFAGGAATYLRPQSPLNKVIGAGFAGPLDERALAAVEAPFWSRGEPVRVELATLASPEVGAQLTARGYQLRGFENVLGLPLAAPRARGGEAAGQGGEAAGISIEVVDAAADATWLDVAVSGAAEPDVGGAGAEVVPRAALEQVYLDFVRAAGFRRYLARIDGQPAGAATLRLDGSVALFCGAATLPAWRRRGVQTALLRARLADARAAGCEVAAVTTEPGSRSQLNVTRQGFALLYARAILIREAPGGDSG